MVAGHRIGRLFLATCLISLAALAIGSNRVVSTARAVDTPRDSLTSVSCGGPASCVAVGQYQAGILIERWDGMRWTASQGAEPPAGSGSLSSVSCPSPSMCMAVGQSGSPAIPEGAALVERWNGAKWSILPNPYGGPDAPGADLVGVYCSSASSCLAVGQENASRDQKQRVLYGAIAEHWNGSLWTSADVRVPLFRNSGTWGSQLNAVSCSGAATCFAVGSYCGGFGECDFQGGFVDRWNGRGWSLTNATEMSFEPTVIACAAATRCLALTGGDTYATWSGHGWSELSFPRIISLTDYFTSATCPTPWMCFAVGNPGSLIARWNRSRWSIVKGPADGPRLPALSGVACARPSRCFAVGGFGLTVIETWGKGRSSLVPSPNLPRVQEDLAAVSCPTIKSCTSVGEYSDAYGRIHGVSEPRTQSLWRPPRTVPGPSGSTDVFLTGTTCPDVWDCFAVGYYDTSTSRQHALLDRFIWYEDPAWSVARGPDLAADGVSQFFGAACPAVVSCFAVGDYGHQAQWDQPLGVTDVPDASDTLIEQWDGFTWSVVPSPNPATDGSGPTALVAISCPAPTSCFAVGTSVDQSGSRALIEGWGGTTWRILRSPSPSAMATLSGISCVSASSCFAVGSTIERWNGRAWTVAATPSEYKPQLTGVSCASASMCMAVGAAFPSSGGPLAPLVERWKGSGWSPVAFPAVSNSSETSLTGVSCPSARLCFASGFYEGKNGQRGLLMSWNGADWSQVSIERPHPPPPSLRPRRHAV